MALCLWKSAAWIGAATLLCACQLVSGLSELDASERGGAGGGGSGGSGSGGASGSSSSGAGGGEPCPKQGCELVVIDNTIVRVDFLATDGMSLFWVNRGVLGNEGSIWRAPLDGSAAPVLVVASLRPEGLVFDKSTSSLYWPDVVQSLHYIRSVSATATDGAPAIAHTADTGEAIWRTIAISPTSKLFWVDAYASRIHYGGVGVASGYFADTGAPHALAVDQKRIYWYYNFNIWAADHDGNNRFSVASLDESSYGMAVDAKYAYWTERTPNGRVLGAPKETQGSPEPIATDQPYPTHVFSDDVFVYWASEGDVDCETANGRVSRITAGIGGGSSQEVLASDQRCPSNFVQAGSSVYWGSGKRIFRAPAP